MEIELSEVERSLLIKELKEIIYSELRGTIPPSHDILRDIRFEHAAQRSLNHVCERIMELRTF